MDAATAAIHELLPGAWQRSGAFPSRVLLSSRVIKRASLQVNYTFTCAPETSSPPPVVVAVPPPPAPPHHGGAPYFQTLVPLSAPVDTSAQVALPPPEVDLFERVVRYTLAFWFTATSACPESPGEPFQSLVLRGANDTDRTPAVYLRNGFLYPRHQTTSGSDAGLPNQFSTSYVQPNTWTHVALVVNGSAMQLYVNGTFDSGGALPGGANFTSGARNATSFVAGLGYCNAPSSVKGVVWLNGAARGAEVASLAAGAVAGKAASSTTSTTTSDSSADAPPCGLVDMTQCCQGTYFCGNCSAWDISYAQGNTMFCSGQSFAPNIVAMCEIYASSGFFFPPLTPACPSPPPSPPPSPQPPSPAPPSPTPPLPPWSSPSLPPTPSPPASLLPPWSPPLMNAPPSPSAYLSPPWMSPSVSPPLANAPPSPPASLSPPWASPPWSPPLMDAPPSPSSPLPLSSPPQPSSPLPSPLAPPLASDGSLPPAPPISDQATIAALQAQLAVLASRMPPALCPSASPFLQRGESGVWTCVPLPIAISAAGDVCRASVVDGANATIACDQPQPAAVPVPPDCMPPGAAWLGYNASAGGWVCTCSIGYTGTSCDILL